VKPPPPPQQHQRLTQGGVEVEEEEKKEKKEEEEEEEEEEEFGHWRINCSYARASCLSAEEAACSGESDGDDSRCCVRCRLVP
jgi:hypothetical protein